MRPDTPIWKLEASLRPVLHESGMQLPVEAGGEHRQGAPNQLFLMGRCWRKAAIRYVDDTRVPPGPLSISNEVIGLDRCISVDRQE
jgi:hypothetical protein